MDPVNNLAQWDLIVGFFLPLVTAVVIRQAWSPTYKAVANFVLSIVAAAGVVYFQGNLATGNLNALVSSVLIVLVASIATYHGLFRPTRIAPAIEAKTG
jgi:hypothetical protein